MKEEFCKTPELLDLWDQATVGKPGDNGKSQERDGRGRVMPDRDNITVRPDEPERGTSAQYALRKLRDDAPELHARVLSGGLSAHAAMRRAALVGIEGDDQAAEHGRRASDQGLRRLLDKRNLGEVLISDGVPIRVPGVIRPGMDDPWTPASCPNFSEP
jgi:hypothetical protein